MVRRAEVNELLGIFRGSVRGMRTALRLGVRWAADRLHYPRGTRLAMGNALVANLFHRLLARDGRVWFTATATRLLTDDGRVVGAVVAYQGRELRIRVRRGVVLAGGGFSASPEWRTRYLPSPTPQYTRAGEGATGDTLALAQAVGGALGEPRDDNAFWFPSSIGRRRDGSTVVFPHIWDRAKPGIVAVNAAGRRFVDESVSYHRFTRAMYDSDKSVPTVPAWLVIDAAALRRYGLGMIRPHTPAPLLRKYRDSGYLRQGATVRELAASIGVDPDGLERTVRDTNRFARTGVDEEFGKGTSVFGHQYGDPEHTPNVNLGPIETAPFYAIAVVPTPLGTALGLRTDPSAPRARRGGRADPGAVRMRQRRAVRDGVGVPGRRLPGGGRPDVRVRRGPARGGRVGLCDVARLAWPPTARPAVRPALDVARLCVAARAGRGVRPWSPREVVGVMRAGCGSRDCVRWPEIRPPGASPGPGPASSRCRSGSARSRRGRS